MIQTRETLEAREQALLAPWAQMSAHSLGRRHYEAPHRLRTEYQRDTARVIHSRAFRRLEYKTQVFLNGTGDHLRTRLTHTMEVASISRAIARPLGLNEDLAEAIALAHDLGHPPFGHAGERALNEVMAGHGGFDHNDQSLRVLERIERKYPEFEGLNLTYELLEGLQKHSAEYDSSGFPGGTGERTPNPSLEAQIVNLADEIAYYSHDLDDGLDFMLIQPSQLAGIGIWSSTAEEIDRQHPSLCGRERDAYIIRCMIDRTVVDVIETTHARLQAGGIGSASAVRRHPTALAGYSETIRTLNSELRRFLYKQLYHHPDVAEVNDRTCEMLKRVFLFYLENPGRLGDQATRRIEADGLHRTVCDYLAGMTDRYLLEEYQTLFN